jgi:hypothetical protein
LPGGARLVVWTIVNLEEWEIVRPMARQVLPPPMGNGRIPDVPNWSWHEYGMRVGFWRFKSLYDRLRIRPTLSINAKVCESYPRVAGACHEAGWEFMGHSYVQMPIHDLDDQRATIRQSIGVQHHESGYFLQRAKDSFDRLYQEGADRAKVMAMAIHPYISGVPHRIKYLEAVYEYASKFPGVLFWNGQEILEWYLEARNGTAG